MICDAHVHVGYFNRLNHKEPFYYSPRRISSILKRCGVNAFIFSSTSACYGCTEFAQLHAEAAELKRCFGKGAYAFCRLTEALYEQDRDLTFLDNNIYCGIKLHGLDYPWSRHAGDLDRIMSILEERNMPLQLHIGEDADCHPADYLPLIKKHPHLRVDFAHCRPVQAVIGAMQELANLYTDTAFMLPERLEKLKSCGVIDRVMFGTDLPVMQAYYDVQLTDYYRKVQKVFCAVADENVMEKNFWRFLNLL